MSCWSLHDMLGQEGGNEVRRKTSQRRADSLPALCVFVCPSVCLSYGKAIWRELRNFGK